MPCPISRSCAAARVSIKLLTLSTSRSGQRCCARGRTRVAIQSRRGKAESGIQCCMAGEGFSETRGVFRAQFEA